MRKKTGIDDIIPAVMPNEMSSKESRQNWARQFQKIYEVDPLVCPKCQGQMRIISFIEELDVIEKYYASLIFGIPATMTLRKRFLIISLNWSAMRQIPGFRFLMNGIDFFEIGLSNHWWTVLKISSNLKFFQIFPANINIVFLFFQTLDYYLDLN